MKKKLLLLFLSIILTVILFTPKRLHYNDGGTDEYIALLYKITDVHQLAPTKADGGGDGIVDGIIIEILGIEIYRNVEEGYID